jgi:hypothetical protein
MEEVCSGMVIIKNGTYKFLHSQKYPYFRTRKYGIWDTGNEKILDTICEWSKEFPEINYGVIRVDTLTVSQLSVIEKVDYFNDFIFIVPSAHYKCILPPNVRVLYSCSEINYLPSEPLQIVSFENKINKIVWRGQIACNEESVPAVRQLIHDALKDDPRCDCKFTNGSWQPPFNPDYRLPQTEQLKYKGIFAIDGGGWPTAMMWILGSGSVPIICSQYRMGLQNELIPWKHFVPISEDLSDLKQNIDWIFSHDDECKEIIKNALEFNNTKMGHEYIMERLRETITK